MQQLTGDPAIFTAINQYPTLIVQRGTTPAGVAPRVRIHDPRQLFDFPDHFLLPPEQTETGHYEFYEHGIGIYDGPLIDRIRECLAKKQIPLLHDGKPVVIVEQWDDSAVKVMQGTVHVTGHKHNEGYIE